jgi:DHA1 family bicyclomycin/chloramphenicol resistance-like MFS transporter
VFVALSILSALIAVLVAVGLTETLPPERRTPSGLRRTVLTMGRLLRDRTFLGHGLTSGLTFGALFAYISGSSFVLQGIYGMSPQLYSAAFALNGLGLIAASQVNARLVERVGPRRCSGARWPASWRAPSACSSSSRSADCRSGRCSRRCS